MKNKFNLVTNPVTLTLLSIHSLEGPSPKTISTIGGLHQMLGMQGYGFAAVARDPIQSLPECNSTNKFGASFETPCGRRMVPFLLVAISFSFNYS